MLPESRFPLLIWPKRDSQSEHTARGILPLRASARNARTDAANTRDSAAAKISAAREDFATLRVPRVSYEMTWNAPDGNFSARVSIAPMRPPEPRSVGSPAPTAPSTKRARWAPSVFRYFLNIYLVSSLPTRISEINALRAARGQFSATSGLEPYVR